MALARIPGIIKYVVLGKERLIQIKRALGRIAADDLDPVGDFLRKYGLPDDFTAEPHISKYREEIESAIAIERLSKKGVENVNKALVETLVAKKIDVKKMEKDIVLLNENGADVNAYLKKVVITADREKDTTSREARIDSFNKTASVVTSSIDVFGNDPAFVASINPAILCKLREWINSISINTAA